jgi:glycosyltransferase involved in cell wall biosynthesis
MAYGDSVKLGIVLSSFERPLGLLRAAKSLIAQKFQNWACVIADDHSEDTAVHSAIRLAVKSDSRFYKLDNHPKFTPEQKLTVCSFSVHINRTMDIFRTWGIPYVCYLLDDVTYMPDRCEEHVKVLDRWRHIDLVWGEQWLREFRADGTVKRERKQIPHARDNHPKMNMAEIKDRLSRHNIINHCSATHRLTDRRWSENPTHWAKIDWVYWNSLIRDGKKFVHIPHVGETMISTPFDIGPMMNLKGKQISDVAKQRSRK